MNRYDKGLRFSFKKRPFFETTPPSKKLSLKQFLFPFYLFVPFKIVFRTINNNKSQNIHQ